MQGPREASITCVTNQPLSLEFAFVDEAGGPVEPSRLEWFVRAAESFVYEAGRHFRFEVAPSGPGRRRLDFETFHPGEFDVRVRVWQCSPDNEFDCGQVTHGPWRISCIGATVEQLVVRPSSVRLRVGERRAVDALPVSGEAFLAGSRLRAEARVDVSFSVTDPSMARYDDGVVEGVAAGRTTLVARAGSLEVRVPVEVEEGPLAPPEEGGHPIPVGMDLRLFAFGPPSVDSQGHPAVLGWAVAGWADGLWLYEWSGSGLGARRVSRPGERAGVYSRDKGAVLVTDERDVRYVVYRGWRGVTVAERQGPPGSPWRHRTLPWWSDPSEAPPEGHAIGPSANEGALAAMPRAGGGLWVAWLRSAGASDPERCPWHLRMAELTDEAVRVWDLERIDWPAEVFPRNHPPCATVEDPPVQEGWPLHLVPDEGEGLPLVLLEPYRFGTVPPMDPDGWWWLLYPEGRERYVASPIEVEQAYERLAPRFQGDRYVFPDAGGESLCRSFLRRVPAGEDRGERVDFPLGTSTPEEPCPWGLGRQVRWPTPFEDRLMWVSWEGPLLVERSPLLAVAAGDEEGAGTRIAVDLIAGAGTAFPSGLLRASSGVRFVVRARGSGDSYEPVQAYTQAAAGAPWRPVEVPRSDAVPSGVLFASGEAFYWLASTPTELRLLRSVDGGVSWSVHARSAAPVRARAHMALAAHGGLLVRTVTRELLWLEDLEAGGTFRFVLERDAPLTKLMLPTPDGIVLLDWSTAGSYPQVHLWHFDPWSGAFTGTSRPRSELPVEMHPPLVARLADGRFLMVAQTRPGERSLARVAADLSSWEALAPLPELADTSRWLRLLALPDGRPLLMGTGRLPGDEDEERIWWSIFEEAAGRWTEPRAARPRGGGFQRLLDAVPSDEGVEMLLLDDESLGHPFEDPRGDPPRPLPTALTQRLRIR